MIKGRKSLPVWLVKITVGRAIGFSIIAFMALCFTFILGIMTGKNMLPDMGLLDPAITQQDATTVPPYFTNQEKQDIQIPDPRELSFYETLSRKKTEASITKRTDVIKRQVLPPPKKTTKPSSPPPAPTRKLATKDKVAYTVQVASFKSKSIAQNFVDDLKKKGFHSKLKSVMISKTRWYRVSSGSFKDIQDAKRHAAAITSKVAGVHPIVVTIK